MKKEVRISIIICTRNREKELSECIDSLINQSYKPNKIIIADNGAIFDSSLLDIIKKNEIEVLYIKNNRNGTSIARNLSLRQVKEDIVFFFDDDVILDHDYIKQTIKLFAEDERKNIGIIVGKITNLKKIRMRLLKKIFFLHSDKPYYVLPSGRNTVATQDINETREVSWASGGAMAVRGDIARKYTFDESFDIFGFALGEDLDYSFRIGKSYKIIFNPHSKIFHQNSKKSRIDERKIGFLQVVNRYKFVIKNMNSLKNKFCFYWSLIGELILNLLSIIVYRKTGLERAIGNIKGIYYLLFNFKKP